MLLKEERRKLRTDTIEPIIKMIRDDYEKNGLATNAVDLLENYISIQEKYARTLEDMLIEEEQNDQT